MINCIRVAFFLACVSIFNVASAKVPPAAILSGQSNAPYAVFYRYKEILVPIHGLPPTGAISSVATNSEKNSIIGGVDERNAYAARISPEGIVVPLEGLIAPGEIYCVAINNKNSSIVVGGHSDTNTPYAALVSATGNVKALDLPQSGFMYCAAIDKRGKSIICGTGPQESAYAALVSKKGKVKPIAGLPEKGGIFWAARNSTKTTFIGGSDNDRVYAAFVLPKGELLPIQDLPLGTLYCVAMNSNGDAVIGGEINKGTSNKGTSDSLPYAALVSRNGQVTTIQNLPPSPGIIYSVAINDSGKALIAGYSLAGPYGAYIEADGTLLPISGLPIGKGFLAGISMDDIGCALVGGQTYGRPFAALLLLPDMELEYLSGLPVTGSVTTISLGSALCK